MCVCIHPTDIAQHKLTLNNSGFISEYSELKLEADKASILPINAVVRTLTLVQSPAIGLLVFFYFKMFIMSFKSHGL